MNKIFQIGFNKCGTCSLKFLLEEMTSPAIKSIHYDEGRLGATIQDNLINNRKLLSGYEDYTFFLDMECLSSTYFFAGYLFKELDEQYPQSKFILNTRDIDKWVMSRLNHTIDGIPYIEYHMKCHSLTHEQVIKKWKSDWKEHHVNVKSYFSNRKDLLVYDIEKGSVERIKRFFPGVRFKTRKFPHVFKTQVE